MQIITGDCNEFAVFCWTIIYNPWTESAKLFVDTTIIGSERQRIESSQMFLFKLHTLLNDRLSEFQFIRLMKILKVNKRFSQDCWYHHNLSRKQVRTKRRPISFRRVNFRDTRRGGGITNIEVNIACLFMCSKCRLLF